MSWDGRSWWGIDLHLILDAGRAADGRPADLRGPAVSSTHPSRPSSARRSPRCRSMPSVWSTPPSSSSSRPPVSGVVGATWSAGDHAIIVLVTLVCSLPFLHDVMLGNVNVLLVGAMVPAMLASPRPRHGILLGLVIAAFAKPLVVPDPAVAPRLAATGIRRDGGDRAARHGVRRARRRTGELRRLAPGALRRDPFRVALRRQSRRHSALPATLAADRDRHLHRVDRRPVAPRPRDRDRLVGGVGDPDRAVRRAPIRRCRSPWRCPGCTATPRPSPSWWSPPRRSPRRIRSRSTPP